MNTGHPFHHHHHHHHVDNDNITSSNSASLYNKNLFRVCYYLEKKLYSDAKEAAEDLLNSYRNGSTQHQLGQAWRLAIDGIVCCATNDDDNVMLIVRQLDYMRSNISPSSEILLVYMIIMLKKLLLNSNNNKSNTGTELFDLEQEVDMLAQGSSNAALLHSLRFLLCTGSYEESIKVYKMVCAQCSSSMEVKLLFTSWMNVIMNGNDGLSSSISSKELLVISNPEVLYRVAVFKMHSDPDGALDLFNKVCISHGDVTPLQVGKVNCLLILNNQKQCVMELLKDLENYFTNSIEIIRLQLLYSMLYDVDISKSERIASELKDLIEKIEPKNHWIQFETASLIASVAPASESLMKTSFELLSMACRICPHKSDYLLHLGKIQMRVGYMESALKIFKKVMNKEEANMLAIQCYIRCQIKLRNFDEAVQQLEFLDILEENNVERMIDVKFSKSLIHWNSDRNVKLYENSLRDCLSLLVRQQQHARRYDAISYFMSLSLDFVCEIVGEYLFYEEYIQSFLFSTKDENLLPSLTESVLEVLDSSLTKAMRGDLELMKIKILLNHQQFVNVEDLIRAALIKYGDGINARLRLVSAEMYLMQSSFDKSLEVLDSLLVDFTVQSSMAFHLLRGKCYLKLENYTKAQEILKDSLTLDVKENYLEDERSVSLKVENKLLLCEALTRLGKIPDFEDLLNDLQNAERNVEREAVALFEANHLIALGKMDEALNKLVQIADQSHLHVEVIRLKGKIFIDGMDDHQAFLGCFQQLVSSCSSVSTYLLLGEAHLRCGDSNEALKAFRHAHTVDKFDRRVVKRIANTLISLHAYDEAKGCLKDVLKDKPCVSLQLILARLCIHLEEFDQVEKLSECKGTDSNGELLIMLADMNIMRGNLEKAKDTLLQAYEKGSNESYQIRARICYKLAQYYQFHGDNQKKEAIEKYIEVLRITPYDEESLLNLARIHRELGEIDKSKQYLTQLIECNLHEVDASCMLAELEYSEGKFTDAIERVKGMLCQGSTSVIRLYLKMVSMQYTPKDTEAQYLYILENVRSNDRSLINGLVNYFSGNFHKALPDLNKHREDPASLDMLFHIYLPKNILYLLGTGQRVSLASRNTIDILLDELSTIPQFFYDVECSKSILFLIDGNVQASYHVCKAALAKKKDHPLTQLCISVVSILKGNEAQAVFVLEQILKQSYDIKFAEEFEIALLLSAYISFKTDKPKGKKFCEKCLHFNKNSKNGIELYTINIGNVIEEDEAKFLQLHCSEWETARRLAFYYLDNGEATRAIETISSKRSFQQRDNDIISRCIHLLRP